MGKGNLGDRSRSGKEHRRILKTNIIEHLTNNRTYIERHTNLNIREQHYTRYINDYIEVLHDVRHYIKNVDITFYTQNEPRGNIIGITIYYYTDDSYPQPQQGLHQHTDVPCCALL